MHTRLGAGRIRMRRTRARRLIYLVAPAGHPNFGDEFIARAWLGYLARTRPGDDVVLDCHTPGQAALLLRGAHPRAVFTDTLWRMIALAGEHARPGPVWEWSAHAATTPGAEPRIDEGIALLQRADVIHLLGGGYLNGVWPHHTALATAAAAVSQRFGARAVATGQGLMPVPGGEAGRALRGAARRFAVFDVRDRESSAVLAGAAGASHSGDDAWLAPAVGRGESCVSGDSGGHAGSVVLCLQSDLTDRFACDGLTGPEALARWTCRVLDEWGVGGPRITAVEGMPGADRVVFDLLGDRVAGANFVPFREAWHGGLPAGRTWISTRFHLHLLAAAAGASGVAVASDPDYYSVKHRSLTEAGSRWTVAVGGAAIPQRPHAGGFAAEARGRAASAKASLAERIYRHA